MYIAVSTPSNNTTLIIGVIVATAILVLAMAAVVIVWLVLRHRRSMVSRQKGNMWAVEIMIIDNRRVIEIIMLYRTAPLLRPPLLRPTFRKKRGGGVTTRTCAFASQLSPPPLPRIRVLYSAVEDENSFDRHAVAVLKDGRVVVHVHVAKHSR